MKCRNDMVNILLILVVVILKSFVIAQFNCNDLLKFRLRNGQMVATFDTLPPSSDTNTWILVRVHVSSLPNEYKGSIQQVYDLLESTNRFKANKSVPYQLNFDASLIVPKITRVEVLSTLACQLLCTGEKDSRPEARRSYLTINFYPNGRNNRVRPYCYNPQDFIISSILSQRLSLKPEDDEICGKIEPKFLLQDRIFNGKVIERGTSPWLVAIFKRTNQNNVFLCGGSLLSSRLILTAAHCFVSIITGNDIAVQVGKYNINDPNEEGFQDVSIERIISHPDYTQGIFDADIAILITTEPIRYTEFIRPICLWTGPTDIDDIAEQVGTTVGWGVQKNGTYSSLPQEVEGRITTKYNCINSNENFQNVVIRRHFCAGNLDGSGPCEGDSGSGFVVYHENRWMLRGVVATGLSNRKTQSCDLFNYVLYADLTMYTNWIEQIVNTHHI